MKCAVGIIQIVIKYSWNLQLEFTVVCIDDKGTHGICTFFLVVLTYFCRMHHSYSYFCTVFLEFAAGRIVPYLCYFVYCIVFVYFQLFVLHCIRISSGDRIVQRFWKSHWVVLYRIRGIRSFGVLYRNGGIRRRQTYLEVHFRTRTYFNAHSRMVEYVSACALALAVRVSVSCGGGEDS
jgi:hypothetical protein